MTVQLLVNVSITAAQYTLVAVGFALVFWVGRFFHFAHAAVYAAGPYLAYVMTRHLGLPLLLSIVVAGASSGLLGCSMEFGVYRPLRRREASSLTLLLASLGMYIVLQNILSLIFGDETRILYRGTPDRMLSLFGARITDVQLATVCVSVALSGGVALLLRRTRVGKAMRAVADSPDLARVSGIEPGRIMVSTLAVGSALAGFSGVMAALDVDMSPTMGMRALMAGVVVVIAGGAGSVPGLVLAALMLATAQHLGVWYIGAQWQDAIAFVILLGFMLLRPQGFFGRPVGSAAV